MSQLQMQAGITGINAIRVYSPAKQFLDHDQDATFVKRWVPELRDFSPAEIAHAEELSLKGYAGPVVNLKERTRLMKDRIFSIRKSETGRDSARETLQRHGSKKRTGGKGTSEKVSGWTACFVQRLRPLAARKSHRKSSIETRLRNHFLGTPHPIPNTPPTTTAR